MVVRICIAVSLVCAVARADFSYEQSTKMTGGAMMGMMRVAGAFSKSLRLPVATARPWVRAVAAIRLASHAPADKANKRRTLR